MLGLCDHPIVVAPMGGGPSGPPLVIAAAEAGAFGFLAAGYKTAAQVEAEINAVKSATTGPFGVNVFIPGKPTEDVSKLANYLRELAADAEALGVELGPPTWDDDGWTAKRDLLVDLAPPVASFTFGLPPPDLVAALQRRGTLVMVTATTPTEAAAAIEAGADCLCLQGHEAGAHRGSFDDNVLSDASELRTLDLVVAVASTSTTPLVAAGGIALPDQVTSAIAAGAVGIQAGTAFLRCDESEAHPLHQAALVDPSFTETAVTRSFSGRRARGLLNGFMRDHPAAPVAYPEINNATRPLRAAAAVKADPNRMSLWAGTGHRHARAAPAAEIIRWLSGERAG